MSLTETKTSPPSKLQLSAVCLLEIISGVFERIIHPINRVLSYIRYIVLALMALLVVSDVLMRFLFNSSIIGVIEIQEFALIIIAFLGFAQEEINNKNLRIDIFVDLLPKWVRNLLDNLFSLVTSILFTIITWQMLIQVTKKLNTVSLALKIPISIFIGLAAIGLAILTITLYRNYILTTIKVIKDKKTPFILISFLAGLSLLLLPYYVTSISFTGSGLALGGLVFLFLFLFMFLGMPIGYAMTLAGYVGMMLIMKNGLAVGNLVGIAPYHSTANYVMAVLPMFMLMGSLAFYSGISGGLFNAASKWLGRLPGGLAISTIVGCAGFGAVCGDSLSTAVTMSKVALPEMIKKNYHPSIAAGSLAAGGTLGILIPPSIGFIIYALIAEQSVGKLFISGIVPGVLLTVLFCIAIYIISIRNPTFVPRGESFSLKEKLHSLKGILGVVVLFVLILGGMLTGFFTPNEGGAIGAFGAFIIALLGKNLTFKNFIKAVDDATVVTARIFLIIIGVGILGYFLTATKVPFLLAELVSGLAVNKYVILALVCILYMILGCLMNVMPMMMLTLPTILPTILVLGFDPIWFGVIIVILMEMGQITPPVGMNVFAISSTAGNIPMQTIYKGVFPFFICMLLCGILLVIFPQLALFLPNLLF